jgi:DNA-binding NarL/FixJ family response regulator
MPTKKPPQTDGKKRILLVDDHPILRRGIAQLLQQEPDLVVCGEAESAHEALKAAEQTQPDLALVDISLKDSSGIELIKDMKIRWPNMPVLVPSMHDETFYAERVLRAGARGYVTKSEASAKVVEGIRTVLSGEIYVSEKVASKVIGQIVGGKRQAPEGFLVDRLSDREFEVFEQVGQGLQTRDIAERMHLSVKTIEAHRENIKKKLNLTNATELLQHAIRWTQFQKGG